MTDDKNAIRDVQNAGSEAVVPESAKNVSEGHTEPPRAISEDTAEGDSTDDRFKALKEESAKHRIRAKELEAKLSDVTEKLQAITVQQIGQQLGLPDAASLVGWDEEWDLDNPDSVRAGLEDFIAQNPHATRPRGDVGQGAHSSGANRQSLSELLRQLGAGS